ncbi:hypothetical protein C498_10336 [Haloferax volcanii DS2]|uniref:Uncharacterized protein n=1 Tax=Haloferax volcanii (strain ATCC 29605 / DSM 3757 / JCM 8879 / NBRC 14742 / NCIMB 2012 / VKM B-1768 / DS2) TaxID=309800 RepID=L9V333_HALVD|nr:hypothetical protein C498_10336 [Haloferax volcanii DS2]
MCSPARSPTSRPSDETARPTTVAFDSVLDAGFDSVLRSPLCRHVRLDCHRYLRAERVVETLAGTKQESLVRAINARLYSRFAVRRPARDTAMFVQ